MRKFCIALFTVLLISVAVQLQMFSPLLVDRTRSVPHAINADSHAAAKASDALDLVTMEADDERSPYHLPLKQLLLGCSEVCGINKPGTPSRFFNYIEKHVDCDAIMQNAAIDAPMTASSPPDSIPTLLLPYFTYGHKVPVSLYQGAPLNARYLGSTAMDNVWTREKVELMRTECAQGILHGTYGPEETNMVRDALLRINVTGHNVLVVGSELPWVEACVLSAGAHHVTTIEYGSISSQHPQVSTYTPAAVRKEYRAFLDRFDTAVSFSSIEHSGLGRYGDSMNPWGDRQAVARIHCMVRSGGHFVVGLPSADGDQILYNARRNYGPLQYAHLLANWIQLWQTKAHGIHTLTVVRKP